MTIERGKDMANGGKGGMMRTETTTCEMKKLAKCAIRAMNGQQSLHVPNPFSICVHCTCCLLLISATIISTVSQLATAWMLAFAISFYNAKSSKTCCSTYMLNRSCTPHSWVQKRCQLLQTVLMTDPRFTRA